MGGGIGPRFALEAAFLILLAVVAGIAELSATAIVVVMGVGWLFVALIEWLAWSEGPRFLRSRAEAPEEPAPASPPEPAPEPVPPTPQPPPQPPPPDTPPPAPEPVPPTPQPPPPEAPARAEVGDAGDSGPGRRRFLPWRRREPAHAASVDAGERGER